MASESGWSDRRREQLLTSVTPVANLDVPTPCCVLAQRLHSLALAIQQPFILASSPSNGLSKPPLRKNPMQLQSFTSADLIRLINREGGPHFSAFLPAPNSVHEGDQDRIFIGNLVREARGTLREYWMAESDADQFLEPLRTFADTAFFAKPRTHAVAMFLCDNVFEQFRIDTPVEQKWFIGRTFHVRSLLPELEQLKCYGVLTLSEKRVALYEGKPHQLEQVTLEGLNESFEEYRLSLTAQPRSQVHSAAAGVRGKQGAVFHGQGGIPDSEPAELENYLKHIDNAVDSYFKHHAGTPLFLAGVDSLTSNYRSVSHCETIVKDALAGNVDHLSAEELRQRISEIAGREHKRRRDQQAFRIREHEVPVETNSELILVAASEGRIDTLFIDQDAKLFGMFDADRRILKEMPRAPTGDPADASHDLIELAAVQTLKTGGTVHAVSRSEMPVDKKMAAALRY